MSDDDLYEDGLFISAADMKLTAPWQVADHGREGPLTAGQVNDLSARFNLQPSDLRQLSSELGEALSSRSVSNMVPVSRSKAAAKATHRLRKTIDDVAAARKRLADGVERLAHLYVTDPNGEQAKFLEGVRADLVSSLHLLQNVPPRLDLLLLAHGSVLVLDPIDKRPIYDQRRNAVLRAVFGLWYRAGRSLSCTTDPISSERRGPVIDFANAVVACVTDPPSALPGETIFKYMMAVRDRYPVIEQVVAELKNRHRDT